MFCVRLWHGALCWTSASTFSNTHALSHTRAYTHTTGSPGSSAYKAAGCFCTLVILFTTFLPLFYSLLICLKTHRQSRPLCSQSWLLSYCFCVISSLLSFVLLSHTHTKYTHRQYRLPLAKLLSHCLSDYYCFYLKLSMTQTRTQAVQAALLAKLLAGGSEALESYFDYTGEIIIYYYLFIILQVSLCLLDRVFNSLLSSSVMQAHWYLIQLACTVYSLHFLP